MQGAGNGVEEGIFFWVWWDGRTVAEGNIGGSGGVVLGGKWCVEGCGEEIFDWLLHLGLLWVWLGILGVCVR